MHWLCAQDIFSTTRVMSLPSVSVTKLNRARAEHKSLVSCMLPSAHCNERHVRASRLQEPSAL